MLAGAVQTLVVSGAAGAGHGSAKQSVRWCEMCFAILEEFPNSCPAHEAGRVQMVTAAFVVTIWQMPTWSGQKVLTGYKEGQEYACRRVAEHVPSLSKKK